MDRRLFLTALAASALGALGAGFASDRLTPPAAPIEPRSLGLPRPAPRPFSPWAPLPKRFTAPRLERRPLPHGAIFELPGDGSLVALTVDDGNDSEVVRLYAKFASDTGMRLTFFLNGIRPSWTENAPVLRPLVESGQVQLANHTWSHPSLLKIGDGEIRAELQRNDDFIRDRYGVEARPYYRPPFGERDARTDAAARSIGYSTPVMWYGTLSDAGPITDAQVVQFASAWLLPQHIVIGHANFPAVTHVYETLVDIIRARSLTPVTLDDVFTRPA